MSQKVYNEVELLDIGEVRVSTNWKNLDLKFKTPDGDLWFQYSEHVDKPQRYQQIMDFFKPQITRIGMTMTVTFEIVQSKNRSTKLRIKSLSNYDLKK